MRWAIVAIALLLTGSVAAAGIVMGLQDQEAAGELFATFSGTPEPAPAPVLATECSIHSGDVQITSDIHADGNVLIVSEEGNIHLNSVIRTANGPSGTDVKTSIIAIGNPTYQVAGRSGRDGGHIVLLAPEGTIHLVSGAMVTGAGGDGMDAAQAFTGLHDRFDVTGLSSENPVKVYGGFGGFGGNIYLGAETVQLGDVVLRPGPGGHGGDATLDGASRIDMAKAGHGGMGGQVYMLDPLFAAQLVHHHVIAPEGMDAEPNPHSLQPTACDRPFPVSPDTPIPASVLTPTDRTCRGGNGGHALTIGINDRGSGQGYDDSIAGIASAGNGGWGCPGGNGGNAESRGAPGEDGQPGEEGSCAAAGQKHGAKGYDGVVGGWGGHAFAGDGGAGAPGQDLMNSDFPTVRNWFHGWGNDKWISYPHQGDWHNLPGSNFDGNWSFPLQGSPEWYVGGNGGHATSIGGDGGDGGPGGDGGDGINRGRGGDGGDGGPGAGPGAAFGGWGGPGLQSHGLWEGTTWLQGIAGVQGPAGEIGELLPGCSEE